MISSLQRQSIDYGVVIALVIFGFVGLAMLLSAGSAHAQESLPRRTSVCRHRPVGKHRHFDAKASTAAWDRPASATGAAETSPDASSEIAAAGSSITAGPAMSSCGSLAGAASAGAPWATAFNRPISS